MRAGGGRRPPGASRVVGGLPSLPPPSDCAGGGPAPPRAWARPVRGTAWGAGASREAPTQLSCRVSLAVSLVGSPSERGDLTCSSLEKAPNEVAQPGLTRGRARQGVRLGRGHRNPVLSLNDMSLTS